MTDENHDLTDQEREAARLCGMSPEEYAAWQSSTRGAEYEARQREDGEHERLVAAVREALDARDAEATA